MNVFQQCTNGRKYLNNKKLVVQEEIARLDALNQRKADYDYDKAMFALDDLIVSLVNQVAKGDIRAKSLLLATLKEKNCITGLQKLAAPPKSDDLPHITDEEKAQIQLLTRNLALLKQG